MYEYIDYCIDCGEEFLKTGPRMIRCRACQRKHTMELERTNSREYYHRVVKKKRITNEYVDLLSRTCDN